jgi:hypothetical protein
MRFEITKGIEILERTPLVIEDMLKGLSEDWTTKNEGPDTWSAYVVVGHLIYAEKADWIPRMEIILSDGADKKFPPFDRFAQFRESKGKSLQMLIEEFKTIRETNIVKIRIKEIDAVDLSKKGIHPDATFGEVTLAQLLSTWVVHDLGHIAQIARVMAKQYKAEVGPWISYLSILNR